MRKSLKNIVIEHKIISVEFEHFSAPKVINYEVNVKDVVVNILDYLKY